MSWKTTLLLIVLAAGGAGWFLYRHAAGPPPAPSGRVALPFDRLTRVEIVRGDERIVLVRGNGWSLEGGWPARAAEVQQVLDVLRGLDSRFEPIELARPDDLARYGLKRDAGAVQVNLTFSAPNGTEQRHTLLFGEGAPTSGNPFTRPTYVRIDAQTEILRLAPGVLAVLDRPREAYSKRQLFPEVERVRMDAARPAFPGEPDAAAPVLLLLDARQVAATEADGSWTLRRTAPRRTPPRSASAMELSPEQLAAGWELSAPVVDRVDPERLRGVLAAVPEIWVERFVESVDPAQAGLDPPERTLSVEFDERPPVTIQIGRVSRVEERKPPAPPANPLAPPPPAPLPVREEFRYARLPGQPQVFEIKADRWLDLFPSLATLRDPRLFRFRAENVRRVELVRPGERFVLAQSDGKWKLTEPSPAEADPGRVAELIDRIGELQAAGGDILDHVDLKAWSLEPSATAPHVALTVADKDKPDAVETLTLWVGKRDEAKKRVAVQVAGNPRVALIRDEFLRLFDRPAVAYRSRRVLDVPPASIAGIAVARADDPYALTRSPGAWSLSAPVSATADAAKANLLANDLARLDAVDFVTDAPKPDDLARFGLDAAPLSVTLTFADGSAPRTLLIGSAREGKPEYYARWTDSPLVFTIRAALRETLNSPSLAWRPLMVWQVPADAVTAIEVKRGGDQIRAARSDGQWKLTEPAAAPASAESVDAVVRALATLRAERYETHSAGNVAQYGLDRPALRATIAAQGRDHSLLIGATVAGSAGRRYAKTADSDAVFVVPDSLLAAVDRPTLDWVDRRLLTVDVARVVEISGASVDEQWTLKPASNGWTIASLKPPLPADRAVVDALLRSLAEVQAKRVVAFSSPVMLERYGLDRPATTVTVVTGSAPSGAEPLTQTLTVSAIQDDAGVAYARVGGSAAIGEVAAALARQWIRSDLDFADRNLINVDPARVIGLGRRGGTDLELARSADGWTMTRPPDSAVDQRAIEQLIGQLARLRVARVIDLNASNLAKYGLDSPTVVTLRLRAEPGAANEIVIAIGRPVAARYNEPEGARYVRVDGSPVIGILPASLSKFLTAEPFAFRDRTLARFDDADRAVVERASRRCVFVKQDGGWRMTEPLAAEAEQSELDALVGAASRLRADEFVADRPTDLRKFGLDAPEARWRFIARDRDVLDLLVGVAESDGDRRFAKLAGRDVVFLLDPELSKRLVAEYRRRSLWPAADPEQIETLIYGAGDKTLVLQRTETGWQIPGRPDQAINAAAVNDLVKTLAQLRADRFVADKAADLAQYGLQTPARTLVFRPRNGQPRTLYLGNAERGTKQLYARVYDPSRSDVFVISTEDSAKLLRDFSELLGR